MILDQMLEVPAVRNEVNFKGFACRWLTLDRLGNLQHPAGFRQIEGARSKQNGSFRHSLLPRRKNEEEVPLPGSALVLGFVDLRTVNCFEQGFKLNQLQHNQLTPGDQSLGRQDIVEIRGLEIGAGERI